MSQIQFTPKIIIDGSTSNEPFVSFTQNHQWTTSNFCLHVNNGYTNLNGIIINGGLNVNDTFYTSNNNNMSFNVTGNNNLIFKTNNLERLRILNNGNIGIGTTNEQDYKVNINGSINTLSIFKNNIELDNIYLRLDSNCWLFNNTSKILYTDPNSNISKIGIGNTEPIGYLHIGSPNIENNNGNIVLSRNIKSTSITSHNFKLGYDDYFNFVMGNLDITEQGNQNWTSQFFINYNAPANSLIISDLGNIGINTSITDTYKVNIEGSLNASSINTVDGHNISNLDYNYITLNSPNLKNLNNWTCNIIDNVIYNTNFDTNVGIGTSVVYLDVNEFTKTYYKLNVKGIINSTNYFINGVDIQNIYLSKSTAETTYLTISEFNLANIWIRQTNIEGETTVRLNNANNQNLIQLGTYDPTASINKTFLNVYGKISANFFQGKGDLITNIPWANINKSEMPNYLTVTTAASDYHTKDYINTTYSNIIMNSVKNNYTTIEETSRLKTTIENAYNAIPIEYVANIITRLAVDKQLSIYYSNIQNIPFNFNSSNFGFNAQPSQNVNNIITVGGTLITTNLISSSNIYENNNLLDNIYISSNNYNKNISNYDKIIDRVRSQLTSEKIYPPQSSKFNNSDSNLVLNSDYGNGLYIIQSSTILLNTIPLSVSAEIAPTSNLFNNDSTTLPWGNNFSAGSNYSNISPFNYPETDINLFTGISIFPNEFASISLYGHSILLYYSEKFIATKIDIITYFNNTNITTNNYPKNIYLIATNNDILTKSQERYNLDGKISSWDILLDNITLNSADYILETRFNDNIKLFKASINIPNNIKEYLYYKLIITSTIGSSLLRIQQLRFYGVENKKNWIHSGNNIYSLSNISIGTINNTSPYILNVNGNIYSSSNIYANSNIGIGITSPLGNLHIGTPYSSSDGTLIISKNNNTSNRNFKLGYDSDFNFVLGDFGSNNDVSREWIKQFYINSNAPENSLTINSYGNIGIGTSSALDKKLFINGNLNVTGTINQSDDNVLNIFKSNIYASNNIFICSNLNVSNIFTSNINVSNYINVNGIIYASKNINIGTSTNLNASLNIQSLNNTIGIWNACSDLNTGEKISSFIGKNTIYKNGFYNYYCHQENNNNYLSWATSNILTSIDDTPDILCVNASKFVGIGITNPTSLFQIRNGGKFKISPNENDYALIGLNDIDTNQNTKIYLNGGINNRIEYFASTGGHIFYTDNSNEQMRINNSGNISIGTTSDIYKLNINGSLYSSSNIYAFSNIGIGITTPLGNLHIGTPYSTSDGTLVISKNNNTSNRNFKFGYDSDFNFVFGDFGSNNDVSRNWTKQFYINSNAPDYSLIINNTGLIGIGISTPLGNLHIGTPYSTSDGTLVISKNNNTSNRNFKFGYDSDFNFVFGDFGSNNDVSRNWTKQFYINSNASEYSLTINSNGNVGIGTSSALDQKLFINGNTTINNGVLNQISSGGFPNYFKNAILINTLTNDGLDYRLNVNGNVNIQSNLNTSNLNVNNTTFLRGLVRIGAIPTVPNDIYNVYIQNNTCINGTVLFESGNFTHTGGNFNINSTNLNVNVANKTSFMGYVGIGTNTNITNIFQVGDGGKLRIANNSLDYTVIGASNLNLSSLNTRIIINGYDKINNKGDIQYYTTNTGKHLFYSDGETNELMRIDNTGNVGIGTVNSENVKLNVNGELNVQNLIKENSSYLSNVYVKLENLNILNNLNFNLKKKFAFNCFIKDQLNDDPIIYNSTIYYKCDIDLTKITMSLTNTSNNYSVNYRLFNIKCFLNNCSFETFNSGVPNILQYDIYMSSNPYMQYSDPPTIVPKLGLNICAIGTPENYRLDNILPSYITLLRCDNYEDGNNFNYLSLVSPHSNLSVSFIIEDYLS